MLRSVGANHIAVWESAGSIAKRQRVVAILSVMEKGKTKKEEISTGIFAVLGMVFIAIILPLLYFGVMEMSWFITITIVGSVLSPFAVELLTRKIDD